MRALHHRFSGRLLISVRGKQISRFLNLCRRRKLNLEEIHFQGEQQITVWITVKDFRCLQPMVRRTHVRIHIIKKQGMPFFLYKSRKRKAFFIAMLLCIIFFYLMSQRVWEIRIEGNRRNTTPEMLAYLKERGICCGIPKQDVQCAALAAAVRKQFGDVTWVSVKLQGTTLILTLREGKKTGESSGKETPCDLYAQTNGRIVKMITRRGTPLVEEGTVCKKGDRLVSGEVEIRDDSQTIVRREYVHADADIYIEEKIPYYYEKKLQYKAWVPTDKKRISLYFRVGNCFLGKNREECRENRITEEEYPLIVGSGLELPLAIGKQTTTTFIRVKKYLTKSQAGRMAARALHRYEKKLEQQEKEITAVHVKQKITKNSCVVRGYLMVISRIGEEGPVQRQEETS